MMLLCNSGAILLALLGLHLTDWIASWLASLYTKYWSIIISIANV